MLKRSRGICGYGLRLRDFFATSRRLDFGFARSRPTGRSDRAGIIRARIFNVVATLCDISAACNFFLSRPRHYASPSLFHVER